MRRRRAGIPAARGEWAPRIIAECDRIGRIIPHHHLARSQADGSGRYDIRREGYRRSCSCADHPYRKAQFRQMLSVMARLAEREAGGEPPRP